MTLTEGPMPTPDTAGKDEEAAWGCVWWWWIIAVLLIILILWAGWGYFGVGGKANPPASPGPGPGGTPVVPTSPPPTPRV